MKHDICNSGLDWYLCVCVFKLETLFSIDFFPQGVSDVT